MPLTPEQTQELHATVERRRAALRTEIGHDLDKVRSDRLEDLAGASPDAGDESVASLISDLDQADTSRDLSELRGLDVARERIADGSYGTCIECGGDIGFEPGNGSRGPPRADVAQVDAGEQRRDVLRRHRARIGADASGNVDHRFRAR